MVLGLEHRRGGCTARGCKKKSGAPVDEHIKRLASCNSDNKIGNAERMVKSIAPLDHFPPTQSWEGSVNDGILPHHAFHWLRSMNGPKFAVHFGARGDVTWFWDAIRSTPQGRDMWDSNPFLRFKTPTDLRKHLPLMIFDDAGVTGKGKSAFCRTWYSLLGSGSDRETRVIMATAHKLNDSDDRSWPDILASFTELAKPTTDPDAWGGILLFFGADLEYICNVCGMKHYNSNVICGYCLTNDTVHPHTDNSRGASWRATILKTTREFKDRFRQPLHPVVAHEWFTLYSYRLDCMHLNDHHGVISHLIGNIFDIQLSDAHGPLPGPNLDARLDFLNGDIAAYNSLARVNSRVPTLKLDNIRGGDFPELKGQLIKAANTRQLIPYVVNLATRAVNCTPTNENKHALRCITAMHLLCETLYNADYFLTDVEKESVAHNCFKLGIHYQWLAVNTTALKWKQPPKLHYVIAHLPEQARLINPVKVQGYKNESMVGTLSNIYKLSMNGPHYDVSSATVLTKYCTGMILAWMP